MDSVVISLGGSVLLAEDAQKQYVQQFAAVVNELSKSLRLGVVVGGGTVARQYINRGRDLGFSESELDELGIAVTRVNALFLSYVLSGVHARIPESTDIASDSTDNVVVMGGTTPGHSTDLVGAELAEKMQAIRFIIATNVDGVYDKDPNKFSSAKLFETIAIEALLEEYGDSWEAAGKNTVIDGPALRVIKKAKLNTRVVNGFKLDEVKKAILGKDFFGTKILV